MFGGGGNWRSMSGGKSSTDASSGVVAGVLVRLVWPELCDDSRRFLNGSAGDDNGESADVGKAWLLLDPEKTDMPCGVFPGESNGVYSKLERMSKSSSVSIKCQEKRLTEGRRHLGPSQVQYLLLMIKSI